MRNTGRRRANDRPPPPTPSSAAPSPGDPWQFLNYPGRDSDASTRPSSSSAGGMNPRSSTVPVTDKAYQQSALQTINAYLSSQSFHITLKPLPSARDFNETLKFILSRLGFSSPKIDDDLQTALKFLNCPLKLNKSALRAPGTPHSWPGLLAVIHWLVQASMYDDHKRNVRKERSNFEHNDMFLYANESYLFYIRGDDGSVDALDDEYMKRLNSAKEDLGSTSKGLQEKALELEKELEEFKTGPSLREKLEQEKGLLEQDVKKFHDIIEQLDGRVVGAEKDMQEKEKELETKVLEKKKVIEENEELKRRIKDQGINSYDAERMRKELMVVEKDTAEAVMARNEWEEKVWVLDSEIEHKLQELAGQIMECNQAIKRLKLGNEYEYHLNAKGTTPSEVLGLEYKSTLKPALASFGDNIKNGSMEKLDELVSLQQQSAKSEANTVAKRNEIGALNSHIEEVEAQLNSVRTESQDYTSRCVSEAKKMLVEVEAEAQNLTNVEKEATAFLVASKSKLMEVRVQTDEEIQLCAREYFMLIDTVSKYKEYVASKTVAMKNDLLETAGAIADLHRGSISKKLRHASEA